MPLALKNNVDIELLIEDSRHELFRRIIFQAPPIPSGHVPYKLASPSLAPSSRSASADHKDEPSSYCIKDSYLSTDKSERIFKVQCDTSVHYYYAFEFKGYVVCPAFLVFRFNVTGYACLDVSNESRYYYIFLSRNDDDQLPIILRKQSKFRGEFKLIMPPEDIDYCL